MLSPGWILDIGGQYLSIVAAEVGPNFRDFGISHPVP